MAFNDKNDYMTLAEAIIQSNGYFEKGEDMLWKRKF